MAMQLLVGCATVVGEPWIEIVIHQTNGEVNFEFFIERRTWWSNRMERVPGAMIKKCGNENEVGVPFRKLKTKGCLMEQAEKGYADERRT